MSFAESDDERVMNSCAHLRACLPVATMAASPFYVIARQTPFVAVAVVLLMCFSAANGAPESRISLSTQALDTRSAPIIQKSQMLELDSEDTFLLSARDISPDVVATGVPSPLFFHRPGGPRRHPENKVLHLRSSLRNVSGLDGFTLQSLPILISELADLLSQTRADLQNHDADSKTPSYQFKLKWSFSVITANQPVQYAYLQAVIFHFVNLLSPSYSPDEITYTRVGVIFNGTIPVANIIIMPLPNAATTNKHVPFSTFGEQSSSDNNGIPPNQPTEVLSVTPSGSTCIYRTVNESAALSPFSTTPWAHQSSSTNLQPRSLETEILTHLSQTAFALSFRLLRDDNGLPTETAAWAIKAIIFIATWQIYTLLNKTATEARLARQKYQQQEQAKKLIRLDTQMFEIAQMNVRLVAEITRKDFNGSVEGLALRDWYAISMMMAGPVGMEALRDAWAMEGEIYGPADGEGRGDLGDGGTGRNGSSGGNNSQVPLGRWELYVGGKEES